MKPKHKLVGIIICLLLVILFAISGRASCLGKSDKAKSGSSDDTTSTPWPQLPAPSNLTATTVSTTQINLYWDDNSNQPDGEPGNEAGFWIESRNLATEYSLLATVGPNVTSYSDIGEFSLFYNTNYYRVRAFDNVGDYSEWSNEASVTINNWLPARFLSVAVGGYHTMALLTDGSLWAWGFNGYGQLGMGDTQYDNWEPFQVGTDSDWAGVVAGEYHSVAIKTTGTIWACGINAAGRLGIGDSNNRDTLTQVGTDSDWSKLALGELCTFAIKTNKTLWAWGYNAEGGQLGVGDTINRYTPSQVGTNSDWINIRNSNRHCVTQKTDKTIWIWGYNASYGALGFGDTVDRYTPTQISTDTDWSIISTAPGHTMAIKNNGMLWGWGQDGAQLGMGSSDNNRITPTQVGTESDWDIVSVKEGCTFAKKTNGTIWAWGGNQQGELGLGYSSMMPTNLTPAQIGIDSDWTTISYGTAIKTNGTFWAWGSSNDFGQLGVGDTLDRLTPSLVGTDSDWLGTTIVNGYRNVLALKTDGTLWVWGENVQGQLGLGDTNITYRTIPTIIRIRK